MHQEFLVKLRVRSVHEECQSYGNISNEIIVEAHTMSVKFEKVLSIKYHSLDKLINIFTK